VPIDRERKRAKRRYDKRQARLVAKAARAHRYRQVAGAVFVMLVVAGGVALARSVTPDQTTAAGQRPTGTRSPTTGASPTPSPTKIGKTYPKPPPKALAQGARWSADVRTSAGRIQLELYGDAAPQTVSSFLFLSKEKFYDDTRCHRVTTQGIYVLQCGDPTGQGTGGPGYQYGIENAPKDGTFPAGTLAMARSSDPGSNGSQFFMVYRKTTLPTEGGGYSVFGKVTRGLDVLQKVAAVGTANGTGDGAPKQPVTITRITVEKK
jgi:peptidyl-prolyl cis-trans isomerase B (cyclophilin B)